MSTVSPLVPQPTSHPGWHGAWHTVWHAGVVLLGDLVVLGAAFFAYAAYQSAFRALFFHGDDVSSAAGAEDALLLLLVAGLTWLVLARWPTSLGTALWLAVPTAVVLLAVGIWASPTTMLAIGIGAAAVGVVDAVLLLAGRPWEQVLSITWVAVILLALALTGTEI